jgi:2-C-methyl-D-erythritol 2,4-cyclodiphosphate synthase
MDDADDTVGPERRPPHAAPAFRIGHGYDIHRFGDAGALVLGGVRFPRSPALLGHSDGDAVLHAVADALLGAAALGDIGSIFPPGDPATRGADSASLLGEIVARVRGSGWAPANVDVTVIAERPRIGPRVAEMRARIAGILGVDPACISVKGKTNEGLDSTGRGEAIAVHAVALLSGQQAP